MSSVREPRLGLRGAARAKAASISGSAAGASVMQPRGGEIRAQIGQQQPHGAEDAGIARHQDARDVELAREPRRVQRPGAAERDQRVVARIVAALHARSPGSRAPCWR